MIRNRRSLLVMLAVVSFIGCAAFSCNYHNAVMAEHDYKSAIEAVQKIDNAETSGGNIDAATHQKIEAIVLKAALGGETIARMLQSNASKQSVLSEIDIVISGLQDGLDNGLLGVKNQATKDSLSASIKAAQAILANVKTFIGGGK